MTHERVAGHVGEREAGRSPDLEIELVEICGRLADSEIAVKLQRYANQPTAAHSLLPLLWEALQNGSIVVA